MNQRDINIQSGFNPSHSPLDGGNPPKLVTSEQTAFVGGGCPASIQIFFVTLRLLSQNPGLCGGQVVQLPSSPLFLLFISVLPLCTTERFFLRVWKLQVRGFVT